MATWTPDPSFYPSPRMAMKAAPETLAYVAAFDPDRKTPDAIAVVDVDPKSKSYSTIIGSTAMPNAGDELHHFGWNACSSCLCPNAPHAHAERRYLVVPGLRSSRIHILDTKPDPKKPNIVKVIEPQEVADKAGYTRPHTVHCGPGGIFMSALGGTNGAEGPGGIALIDHDTFEVIGPWELDRGPQFLAYDVWWHLKYDTVLTSEWGPISMIEPCRNCSSKDDFLMPRNRSPRSIATVSTASSRLLIALCECDDTPTRLPRASISTMACEAV